MIHRGDICWVDLRPPVGSEPGYRRPVLIVSNDEFNRSRVSTAVAAAITSNLRLAEAPGNVLLPAEESGLNRDSVVNVSQIVTVDKSDLSETRARVNPSLLRLVEDGLSLVLGLVPGRR